MDIPSLNLTPNFSFEPCFVGSSLTVTTQEANACSPWTSCFTYALGVSPLTLSSHYHERVSFKPL